ncbi:ring-cleaving dioxygenase [Arenibaculum pallidiluteum]|uniref:ring-cleaving dioxygenase n=1 Tax=Arenibaculum pallidiluteum TaxID=2812559 RepID=UPI001A95FCBD|nr:ring-cleaving dioxygenase [Arenibaculum pallidiluteum]
MRIVTGFHHVTACVAGAQEDIDFLTQVVGQRMIKQTVLFDGTTSIYHLYYANKHAEIGTVMTTFPFKQAGITGRKGTGQVSETAYSVSSGSLDFWARHLDELGVKRSEIHSRFGRELIRFSHPGGLELEVVGDDRDTRDGYASERVPEQHSVRGFNSVTMSVRDVEGQDHFLVQGLGYEKTGEEGRYHRYELGEGGPGRTILLRHDPEIPQGSWYFGAGTVHHMALAVANDDEQAKVKAHLEGLGYTDVSESKDRNYFHSCYVRSPGGVLVEIATTDIGFAVDEPVDELGEHLLLPPWFEPRREEICSPLEPIVVPTRKLTESRT